MMFRNLGLLATGLLAAACGGDDSSRGPSGTKPADAAPSGLWHPAPVSEVPEGMEDLADLPYLRNKGGGDDGKVTVYVIGEAQEGWNLIVGGHHAGAELMGMKEPVVHEWQATAEDVWPDGPGFSHEALAGTYWRRAAMRDNGHVVALFDGIGLAELDARSKVVWKFAGRCHDDFSMAADGMVYALIDGDSGDSLVVLGVDGKEQRRMKVADHVGGSRVTGIHALSVACGDWPAGSIVLSAAGSNTIAVIDAKGELLWSADGPWKSQQRAEGLGNGNLLVFDNGFDEGYSRVLEFDPKSGEIVWSYDGNELTPFFTPEHGACQRLANGNTLIVESQSSRVFETTPKGKLVWQCFGESRNDDQEVANLLQVQRIDESVVAKAFPELVSAGGGEIDIEAVKALGGKNK